MMIIITRLDVMIEHHEIHAGMRSTCNVADRGSVVPCQRGTDMLVKFGTGTSSLDVAASYDANVVCICL